MRQQSVAHPSMFDAEPPFIRSFTQLEAKAILLPLSEQDRTSLLAQIHDTREEVMRALTKPSAHLGVTSDGELAAFRRRRGTTTSNAGSVLRSTTPTLDEHAPLANSMTSGVKVLAPRQPRRRSIDQQDEEITVKRTTSNRGTSSHGAVGAALGSSLVLTAPAPSCLSTFGHCIVGSIYFHLEAILVALEADRLTLYVEPPGGGSLLQSMNVGIGMPVVRKPHFASNTSIVHAVFSTGIAANLDEVGLDDVAECPGPTVAKNAIVFPVLAPQERAWGLVGVVVVVNKRRGLSNFVESDEALLAMRLPAIGYILKRYPVDILSTVFDPTPIHALHPIQPFTPNPIGLPESASPPVVEAVKVYHRGGGEKFVRRQNLVAGGTAIASESVAQSVVSVQQYIMALEECWRGGVLDKIELERSLRQKAQNLAEAKEILLRKQRRFDILKETLCEQLEKSMGDATKYITSGPQQRRSTTGAAPLQR